MSRHRSHTDDSDLSGQMEDEARDKYNELRNQSKQKLEDIISVKRNEEDGKEYLAGFIPVPNGMENTANRLAGVARPYIGEKAAGFGYKWVSEFFTSADEKALGKISDKGHSRGLLAAKIISGAVIAVLPAIKSFQTYFGYRKDKAKVKNEFALVFEANRLAFNDNELVQTALRKYVDKAKSSAWEVASDIPNLAIAGMYAVEDYKALQQQFETQRKTRAVAHKPINESNIEAHQELIEREKFIKEWITNNRSKLEEELKTYGFKNEELKQRLAESLIEQKEIAGSFFDRKLSEREDARSRHEPEDKKSEHGSRLPLILGAEIATGYLQSHIDAHNEAHSDKLNAAQMYKYLKEQVEQQCGRGGDYDCNPTFQARDPDQIDIGGRTLTEYIAEIVRQNERDNGRTDIGEVFMPDLMKKIRPLAEAVANRTIDVAAVATMVGERRFNKRAQNGRITREFVSEEQVNTEIKSLMPVMGTREVMENKNDFYKNFLEPERVEKQVKENLKTKDILFAALLPDEILEQQGLKKAAIADMRKATYKQDAIYYYVATNAVYLADKGQEYLKKLDIGDKATEVIMSLAEKVKSGDMEALKVAVDGENKAVVFDAIRSAGLLEQIGNDKKQVAGDKNYWIERQKEIPRIRQEMESATKRRREDETNSEDQNKSSDELQAEENKVAGSRLARDDDRTKDKWEERVPSKKGWKPEDVARGSDGASENTDYLDPDKLVKGEPSARKRVENSRLSLDDEGRRL